MTDSNKNVVKAALSNMVPTSEDETFDFPALPYVCQKRLAEILDPETLKTFAAINATTRNLSKRCHIVKDAEVKIDKELSECKYTLSCFCKEDEFCRGVHEADLSSLKKKIDVHELIYITTSYIKNVKIDAHFLQSLPFNFDSSEALVLEAHCIKLDDLKMIMHTGLRAFLFTGGIESDCSKEEFMDFIKSLTHLDAFGVRIINQFASLSFNIDELASEGAELLSQKVITIFETDSFLTSFRKN